MLEYIRKSFELCCVCNRYIKLPVIDDTKHVCDDCKHTIVRSIVGVRESEFNHYGDV